MKKVAIGCGIAFLVVVVVVTAGITYVVSWVKTNAPDTQTLARQRYELRSRHGEAEAYAPDLAGGLVAERLARYVQLQESVLPLRHSLAARLMEFAIASRSLDRERGPLSKLGQARGMVKDALAIGGDGVAFLEARSESLLAIGMGEGEYAFWFVLTSFVFLEWDPLELAEPPAEVPPEEEIGYGRSVPDLVRKFRNQHRDLFVRQLENARDALAVRTDRSPSEERTLALLDAALEDAGADAFPFAGSLPPEWTAVLEPYRSRLAAALPATRGEALAQSIEILLADERGFHVDIDIGDGPQRELEETSR